MRAEYGRIARACGMDPELFSLQLFTHVTCVACKAVRRIPRDGKAIMHSTTDTGSTYIIRDAEPCGCGEARVWVQFDVESS